MYINFIVWPSVLSLNNLKITNKNKRSEKRLYARHIYRGALAAQRAAKRSPILIWERKGNPGMDFLMVIMASGIARGHVRMTTAMATATELRRMAAILQIIGLALVYHVLL